MKLPQFQLRLPLSFFWSNRQNSLELMHYRMLDDEMKRTMGGPARIRLWKNRCWLLSNYMDKLQNVWQLNISKRRLWNSVSQLWRNKRYNNVVTALTALHQPWSFFQKSLSNLIIAVVDGTLHKISKPVDAQALDFNGHKWHGTFFIHFHFNFFNFYTFQFVFISDLAHFLFLLFQILSKDSVYNFSLGF